MSDRQPPRYSSETFLLLSTLALQGEGGEDIEEPREAHSTLPSVKMQSVWLFHSSCALRPSPGPSICFKLYLRLQEGPCRLSLLILQRKKLRLREKDVGWPTQLVAHLRSSAYPQGRLQTASFPAMASYLSLPEGSLWPQEHTQPAGRTGQMCQEVTTVTA